jgi:hypothetical protein
LSGVNVCICKGQPLNRLVAAFATRSKAAVAEGVGTGKPVDFKQLQLTAVLVKKLADGDSKMPFDARYRSLDHHLPECPCSPRYTVAPAESR